MRVLIVDNDSFSKANAKIYLQGVVHCEEAETRDVAVASFQSAIEDGSPFNLVLVDIELTDTEGESILTELRAIEEQWGLAADQKARIFVTTAKSGRQLETDCLMLGCDEFFSKPLDKNRLFSKLDGYGLLPGTSTSSGEAEFADRPLDSAAILNAATKRLKKGDLNLPPAPKIALKLRQLIDCDADLKDVVELLNQDLAVATKLISVSNSAFYRGIEKNKTLAQATGRLGLNRTREVVMSICCRGFFATNHPVYKEMVEMLWWHSLASAHIADMVADNLGWRLEADLFSICLLHDIGKLFLIQLAGDLQQRKHSDKPVNVDDLLVLMDDHHERMGANILKTMGYPDTFVKTVANHHRQANASTPQALKILQQADLLAKAAGFGLGQEDPQMIDAACQELGIGVAEKEEAIATIGQRMAQLRFVFG